jgi:DNA-binding PadR family transcriptional regulator
MPPQTQPVATPQATLDDLLNFTRQRRTSTPLRRSFLQAVENRAAGPMHGFVSGRRDLALDLYLLLHCGAAAGEFDVALPAMAWARALDRPQTLASETTISKNWTWLEANRLVQSHRVRRLRKMYLLREDGSGKRYSRPKVGEPGHGYFDFPFSYFTQRWHKTLSLRAKATLLICLAQKPPFELRTEHATTWYGVSPDSMQRGLDELREHCLLATRVVYREAPRARLGFTQVHLHELLGDFAIAEKPERKQLGVAKPRAVRKKRKTDAKARSKGSKRAQSKAGGSDGTRSA